MQKSFDFGDRDAARKRAAKLSHRKLAMIGAVVVGYDAAPVTHYEGFVGFKYRVKSGNRYVHFIGKIDACRVVPVDASKGSPRHDCYLSKPWVFSRLVRIGRNAVIVGDLKPADWRNIDSAALGALAGAQLRQKVKAVIGDDGMDK